jgi:hypothetical protein
MWQILRNFNFSTDFLILNAIKICPVGADLFRADKQQETHDETNSGFPRFYERA